MKNCLLILCIILLVGCKSKQVAVIPVEVEPLPTIEKVTFSDITELQKTKAYTLGKRTLNICNTSVFIPFNESEATQSVIQNTTLDKHSKNCRTFNARYGSFKDLKLVQIFKNNSTSEIIFRYKAIFDHANANKELRLTLNNENKVSSLRTLDWKEKL